VVYREEYNITLAGLQRLHPFDSEKYGRVARALARDGVLTADELTRPEPLGDAELQQLSAAYRQRLRGSRAIAEITEIPPVAWLPRWLVRSRLLMPMRHAAGGTLLAARLALRRGWAVNLGGGYHHASLDDGGGFCVYPDITLAVSAARAAEPRARRVMVIDLDAHQGNGHARDLGDDEEVYILDIYNHSIYPGDAAARRGVDLALDAPSGTDTGRYLELVGGALDSAFADFAPQLVIYNAGTDILQGDPLGAMAVCPEGVLERDARVFDAALARDIPVVMLLSGGYQRSNAEVIAGSIQNLFAAFDLRERARGSETFTP